MFPFQIIGNTLEFTLMILATQIDHIAEAFNALPPDEAEQVVAQFGEEQEAILHYILSDDFEVLGVQAQETLLYGAIIIWQATRKFGKQYSTASYEKIDDIQFENWERADTMTQEKGQSFNDFIDPFFENYEEEELLELVAGLIDEDDDNEEDAIPEEYKLPVFVALKSVIDSLVS